MDWLLVSVFHLFFGYGSILSVVPGIMIRFSDVLKGFEDELGIEMKQAGLCHAVICVLDVYRTRKDTVLLDKESCAPCAPCALRQFQPRIA